MSTIDKKKFQFVERDDFASETIDAPSYSYWKSVFRQFFKKRSTIFMLAVLIGILLMSFVYPMFSNFDYNDVSKVNDFTARLNPPSAKAFFGTDNNGKSLFDGVWFGARNSIITNSITLSAAELQSSFSTSNPSSPSFIKYGMASTELATIRILVIMYSGIVNPNPSQRLNKQPTSNLLI